MNTLTDKIQDLYGNAKRTIGKALLIPLAAATITSCGNDHYKDIEVVPGAPVSVSYETRDHGYFGTKEITSIKDDQVNMTLVQKDGLFRDTEHLTIERPGDDLTYHNHRKGNGRLERITVGDQVFRPEDPGLRGRFIQARKDYSLRKDLLQKAKLDYLRAEQEEYQRAFDEAIKGHRNP